jgi:hypothetical protein
MKHFPSSVEAFVLVGYDPTLKEFFLYVPYQTVGGASVQYNMATFYTDNPGAYIVLDVHGHPTFAASFSGTDSKDDCRDRYSGVLGHLDKLVPTYSFRFGCMNKHFKVELEDIFEDKDIKYDYLLDFKEAVKRIKTYSAPKVVDLGVGAVGQKSLNYYNNFLGSQGTSHYVSDNPTHDELMAAYGWSFEK